MRLSRIILSLIFPALMLAGCHSASERKVITVSIEPQRYLLEQIVGDRYDVNCLLADGANPETYDPSMTRLLNLERSSAYMMAGHLPFEEAIIAKVQRNNPDLPLVDTSAGIDIITGTHSEHSHGEGEHSHDTDPHLWTSVKNARVMASNMLEALKEIDPENTGYYAARHAVLDARLDSLDKVFTAKLAPAEGTTFAVWHPSLSYFARDYGLRQLSLSPEGKEASVTRLKAAADSAALVGVKVLFFQQGIDSRQALVANESIGALLVEINPLAYDWEGQITAVADALAR